MSNTESGFGDHNSALHNGSLGSLDQNSSSRAQAVNQIDESKIYITGISGRFPQSENVDEFFQHMLNGDDLVTEDNARWEPGLYDLPKRHGKLLNLNEFDANAFGVSPKQAHAMDPQLRKLLEVAYEAIVDSGHDPRELRGTNTGVFIGASDSESVVAQTQDPYKIKAYSLIGGARSMFANRLSFTFDLKGPSFAVDTACSSSLLALALAYDSMRLGRCDSAIVAGVSLTLSPNAALQFKDIGMLSDDGKCKSFDATGTGYVRSECVSAVFLEKVEKPCRIYCEVVHARSNTDGYKMQGATFPSGEVQQALLEATYKDAMIDPNDVSYVEAHGTGTMAGDPQEVNAIENVLCTEERTEPLLIGSVKSVMGHAEPASGVASLAKVVGCMENGVLVPNLHYEIPNPEIPSLINGKIKVVTELTPWSGGYVGMNSFGFGGANVHVILKSHEDKPPSVKDDDHDQSKFKRLIRICGRTEEALRSMFDSVTTHADNDEYLALIDRIANQSASFCKFRGFALSDQVSLHCLPKIQRVESHEKRPIWFVYSGMGTQYVGMAVELMHFDVFRDTINQCDQVLKPLGINLAYLIMSKSEVFNTSILMAFVGLCCIQIALTNLLKQMNIQPDGIVGHSIGELCCAYADGCLTLPEVVMCAYWRGKCVEEVKFLNGAMAAVGISWKMANQLCPEGVEPACHNSEDSVTVSGRRDAVLTFIEKLRVQGTFVKEVSTLGYAFHSSDMRTIAPALERRLKEIITEPKGRSKKWVSTSVLIDEDENNNQNEQLAKTCSAEYLANNLCSPVYFHEAMTSIPENAIVVEIAPHCLMQAILRRTLPKTCSIIGISSKNADDKSDFTLESIGKVYNCGVNIETGSLYKEVKFPVSKGTPMVGPMVKWDHSEKWYVASAKQFSRTSQSSNTVVFNIDSGSESAHDRYLVGHKIDGRVLFPFTGYIVLAWKAISRLHSLNFLKTAVEFNDIIVHRPRVLHNDPVSFEVSILHNQGQFEIVADSDVYCSGKIKMTEKEDFNEQLFGYLQSASHQCEMCGNLMLNSKEIYSEMRMSGYEYEKQFRSLQSACNCGGLANIEWTENYVTFIDAMLQTTILSAMDSSTLKLPTRLRFIRIDPELHSESVVGGEDSNFIQLRSSKNATGMIAGGVEIADLTTTTADRKLKQIPPTLEKVCFTPFEYPDSLFEVPLHQAHIREYSAIVTESKNDEVVTVCPEKHVIAVLGDLMTRATGDHETVGLLRADCLFRNAWHETPLKALGDIILENTPGNFLNSCIVDGFDMKVARRAKQSFELSPLLRTTWSAVNGLTDNPDFNPLKFDPEKYPFISTIVQWNDKSLDDVKFHVILVDYVISSHSTPVEYLKLLSSKMHDGGFILASEQIRPIRSDVDCKKVMSIDEWKTTFDIAGLRTVAYQSDQSLPTCLFLLRKVAAKFAESINSFDIDIYEEFSFIDELKLRMIEAKQQENGRVHMITKNVSSGIFGFVQSLRAENEVNQPVKAILLESDGYGISDFNNIVNNDLAFNCFREGKWGSWRHFVINEGRTDREANSETVLLTCLNRGDLNTLKWVHDGTDNEADDISKCHVKYASLNFRDVMLASGRLPPSIIPGYTPNQQSILGCEFSGIDAKTNKRVMGIAPYGCIATNAFPLTSDTWEVPTEWSLEQAASVPVAYMTSYYALIIRGDMKPTDSVLIHSGSGGVGQAAITIALGMGATVYTTVGIDEKKQYLQKRFGHHEKFLIVGSTRNCKFEQRVMELTNGEGVNVVLNSLSEEKFQASVRCLAMHGRFCEIGKYDMSQNSSLGMSVFLRNVDFHGVLADSLRKDNPDRHRMRQLFTEGLANGHVVPLNTHVFESDHVSDAFRFMAQGKHMGKVLINVDKNKINLNDAILQSAHKSHFESDEVFLITGGLGGVGLQLASWLAERGAKKLVLTSRSGLRNGNQKRCVKKLRDLGVDVEISTLDVAKSNECEELIKSCQQNGPLGGIFHLAMVLRDVLFEDQSADNFVTTSAAKISGTKNLDVFTRRLCGKELKYFVAFSSIASGRGNKGQTAYAWSNSAMERIIANRKSDNFAGMAIQWGAIGDTGIVMEIFQSNDANVGGTLPQRIENVFKVFDWLIGLDFAIVSSFVRAPTEVKNNALKSGDLLTNIANVLGASDIKAVDLNTPLGELGLDSLMGAEIRQMLEGDYDIILSMKEIRAVTIKQLQDLVKSDSGSKKLTNLTETGGDLLKLFSVRVNPNELLQTEMIVKMNNVSEGSNLFFVHSIEGISTTVKELSILINCPVYCLQQTPDVSMENMRSIAQSYIQTIKSVQKDGPYNLAGYSFGGCIAYEITKCLNENDESVQNLIFLDTSHIFMDNYREMFRAAYKVAKSLTNNPIFEAEILCGFMMRFCEFDYSNIRNQLVGMADWRARVKFIGEFLIRKNVFKDQNAAEFSCQALRDKIIVADSYHPEANLEKMGVEVCLIRAERGALDTEMYGSDYSLSKAFTKPISVSTVGGDHDSFIHDTGAMEVARILNAIFTV